MKHAVLNVPLSTLYTTGHKSFQAFHSTDSDTTQNNKKDTDAKKQNTNPQTNKWAIVPKNKQKTCEKVV